MVQENNLFLIKTSLAYHKLFYVEATDILEATRIANLIVGYCNDDSVVESVSSAEIPLMSLVEEK